MKTNPFCPKCDLPLIELQPLLGEPEDQGTPTSWACLSCGFSSEEGQGSG